MPNSIVNKYFGRMGNTLFQLSFIYAQVREGKLPDIYLQDYRYFDKYKEDLKNLFIENLTYDDRVSLHVRRGTNPIDPKEVPYAENPFYVDLSKTNYYEQAMKEFPDRKFLVFSDDINWCKQQEIFKDCDFSEGKNEEQDFLAMAGCDGHINANSTFSFWTAYLGNGQKVVIPSAKNWYADGKERTICPSEWIRI